MTITTTCLAWLPTGTEWLIIGLFGLLLFGKRLPEVAKSMGKSVVEFKKGLRGVEEDIDKATNEPEMLPPPDKTAEAAKPTTQAKTTTSA